MKRSKLILLILPIILLAGMVFIFNQPGKSKSGNNPTPESTPQTENKSPQIVSTKPAPLEEATIPANGIIEITFNTPLENEPEFKRRIDPEIKYKVELSGDRKTVKFIPEKPYELGVGYTLFILPDTKFEGGGKLDGEKTFHFSTIKYRGV